MRVMIVTFDEMQQANKTSAHDHRHSPTGLVHARRVTQTRQPVHPLLHSTPVSHLFICNGAYCVVFDGCAMLSVDVGQTL